jgi:hypothetical protein
MKHLHQLDIGKSNGLVTFILQHPLVAKIDYSPLLTGQQRLTTSKRFQIARNMHKPQVGKGGQRSVGNVRFGIWRHLATETTSGLFSERYNL